jgi:hypothetical protein
MAMPLSYADASALLRRLNDEKAVPSLERFRAIARALDTHAIEMSAADPAADVVTVMQTGAIHFEAGSSNFNTGRYVVAPAFLCKARLRFGDYRKSTLAASHDEAKQLRAMMHRCIVHELVANDADTPVGYWRERDAIFAFQKDEFERKRTFAFMRSYAKRLRPDDASDSGRGGDNDDDDD